MTTFYECQFAPNAATRRDVTRVAQLVRDQGQSVYEAFAPQAFAGWGKSDIAVLIAHDPSKRAGTVTALSSHGDWHIATFMLDGPYAAHAADLIERSGAVSPDFSDFDKDPDFARPLSPHHSPTHWYTRARLNEISVATPGAIAWYADAKVTRTYEPKTPAATVRRQPAAAARTLAPDHTTATEIYCPPGAILHRPGIGRVTRVR
ncbi:MAG TPA: hypothetical protein VFL61_09680 [Gaiellaceae bacterium]|nr:hypothetical protein [Gaiellaceae bacterium]